MKCESVRKRLEDKLEFGATLARARGIDLICRFAVDFRIGFTQKQQRIDNNKL